MRGHYKNTSNEDFFQMIVADDIAEEYHDTMGFFFQVFYDKYTKIKYAFEIDTNVLVMFKNITTTSKYDQFF